MTQQFHFLEYIKRKWKHWFKKIQEPPISLQHFYHREDVVYMGYYLDIKDNYHRKHVVYMEHYSDIKYNGLLLQFNSVSQSCPTLRPHEPQHTRPPCLSPTPAIHLNPCPLNLWCHPTISSSVIPLSSCPQSFPHQGLFKWVSSLHQVAKVLEFQLQHQSVQWTLRIDLL